MTETAQTTNFLPQTFEEIEHQPLRVYNRVATMYNLLQDFGKDACAAYISQFTQPERQELYLMQQVIKLKGLKAVQGEVTKDLVLEDD